MAILFVTTDLAKWGVGTGILMDPEEIDNNFWELVERVFDLENPGSDEINGIDHFEVSGDQFYVHLTDLTVLGPYDFPVFSTSFRGEWAPLTVYTKYNRFIANGQIYEVLLAHTSAATFDAGANNGLGDDYYGLWLELPELQLPPGGGDGYVLAKVSESDFDIQWVNKGLPIGGDAGDVLIKTSGEDYDTEWRSGLAPEVDTISTTTFDPVLADANKFFLCTNPAGCVVRMPTHAAVPYPISTELHFVQESVGGVALIDDSSDQEVTLNGIEGYDTATEISGAVITAKQVAINRWRVWGLLAVEQSDSSA